MHGEKLQNGSGRSSASHVPLAAVCPPVRCYFHDRNSRTVICGEPASFRRPGGHWFNDAFFCDRHRGESDVPIVGELVVRRLVVDAKVLLTGASMTDPFARAEAMRRLEQAVGAIGGLLEVGGVYSAIMRYAPPPAVRAANGSPGIPE